MRRIMRIAIPIAGVTAAVVLAALVLSSSEGPFTNVTIRSSLAPIDVPEATQTADTIVLGVVSDVRNEPWQDPDFPVVNVVTLQVESYLKNALSTTTLEVRDFGQGVVNHPTFGKVAVSTPDSTGFTVGERVLVFLDYDKGNVLGDGYYLVGSHQGKYTIENGMAKNADPRRNMQLQDLIDLINRNK